MGLMGTFYSGIKANSLDIAPNYAGKYQNHTFSCVLCCHSYIQSM